MNPPPLKSVADLPEKFCAGLLERGIAGDAPLLAVKDGGNNQVFRIQGGGNDFALKRYFQHPGDLRDRFNAERSFYTLLWNHGVRQIPEPFGWDAENRLGLFSFLEGRKLKTEEINRQHVAQALDFVRNANALRSTPEARQVATASDGFFSIAEQIQSVGGRVATLQGIERQSVPDQKALDFAKNELKPAWENIFQNINQRLENSPALKQPLDSSRRCLSPSDFGYHNALLAADRLQFIDFEYAGWDDPAKLVCDFFCQPQIPVSLEYWDQFNQSVAASLGMGDELAERTRLLFPMFQIKWCCIILNPFIKVGRARREFAGAASSEPAAMAQLEKARKLLQTIEPSPK